jgi:hypothetical protein
MANPAFSRWTDRAQRTSEAVPAREAPYPTLLFSEDPKIRHLPEGFVLWKEQIVSQVGHDAQAWRVFDLDAPIVEDRSLSQFLGSGSTPILNCSENRDKVFEAVDQPGNVVSAQDPILEDYEHQVPPMV